MKKSKKLAALICAASMTLGLAAVPSNAANFIDSEPVFVNFDDSVSPFPNWITTTEIDTEHGKSFVPVKEYGYEAMAGKIFDTKSGVYKWSFDLYLGEASDVNFFLGVNGQPSGILSEINCNTSTGAVSYYIPTSSNVWNSAAVGGYTMNTGWNKVDQIIDLDAEKVYCYIEGEKVYEKSIAYAAINALKSGSYKLGGFRCQSASGTVAIDNMEIEKYEKNDFNSVSEKLMAMPRGAEGTEFVLDNTVDKLLLTADKIKVRKYNTSDVMMKNPTELTVTVSNADNRSFTLDWGEAVTDGYFYAIDMSAVKGIEGNTFKQPVKIMMAAPAEDEIVTDTLVSNMDFESLTLENTAEDGTTKTTPSGLNGWSYWTSGENSGIPSVINNSANIVYSKYQPDESNTMLGISFADKLFSVSTKKFKPAIESGKLIITTDLAMASKTGGYISLALNDMSKDRSGTDDEYVFIQAQWGDAWIYHNGSAISASGVSMGDGSVKNFTFEIDLETRAVTAKIGSTTYTLTTIPEAFNLMSDSLYYSVQANQTGRAVYIDNISVTHEYIDSGIVTITDENVPTIDFDDLTLENTEENGVSTTAPSGINGWSFWNDAVVDNGVPTVCNNIDRLKYSVYDNSGDKMLKVVFGDKGFAASTNKIDLANESGKLVITTDFALADEIGSHINLSLIDMSKDRSGTDDEYRFVQMQWGAGWLYNHAGTQLSGYPSAGSNGVVQTYVFEVDLETREVKGTIGSKTYTLTTIPEEINLMSDSLYYTVSSVSVSGRTVYIDDVSVTHTYEKNTKASYAGGVTYEDYKGDAVATENGTVTPNVKKLYVPVSTGVTSSNISIALKDGDGNVVSDSFTLADNTATMVLGSVLKQNTEYTISIGGSVANAGDYTFKTGAGAFDVSGLKLVDTDGNVVDTISSALTGVKINADVINNKDGGDVYFIIASYSGNQMKQVFLEKYPAPTGTQANVYATAVTIGTEEGQLDLTDVDKIKAYAWDSMTTVKPFCDYAEIELAEAE